MDTDLSLPLLLIEEVLGEGNLLLVGVLAGVLLLGLGGELLPEFELGLLVREEIDLDLFLPLLAGLWSAEACLVTAEDIAI